jgi:hypothetical protein
MVFGDCGTSERQVRFASLEATTTIKPNTQEGQEQRKHEHELEGHESCNTNITIFLLEATC